MVKPRTKAAAVSLASVSLLIALKISASFYMGSISVLSEALHSVADFAASLTTFLSLRIADQPPDAEHPFGHGKAENVSGVVEAGLIVITAAFIFWEAGQKILEGAELRALDLGMALMTFSALVSVVVSRYLYRVARETGSLALEADARNYSIDIWTALGVFAGLLVVRLTGIAIIDPLVAIGVGFFILRAAYGIGVRSFWGLVDTRLPESEEAVIRACIDEHLRREVVGFHGLRTRRAGRERHIDLHLVVAPDASVEEAHRLCDHLEADIRVKLPYSNVTIHVEPCQGNPPDCLYGCPVGKTKPCFWDEETVGRRKGEDLWKD
ncbi:MAG: cation transporter [Chloroflexi bacterium]|nr:cation transporter [Chloroflexota bacterium]